jgi:uncharacterized metal-binding protein YceD (DUF177 family)
LSKLLNTYNLQFSGLKQGKHEFDFDADKKFFEAFSESGITEGKVHFQVQLDKQSTLLSLHITLTGSVKTQCARCGDDMSQDLSNHFTLIVKFSENPVTETDEIVVLPHSEHQINLAQHFYEYIMVSIPVRAVHKKGECNKNSLNILKTLTENKINKTSEEDSDPRWDILKKLQNKDKNGTS